MPYEGLDAKFLNIDAPEQASFTTGGTYKYTAENIVGATYSWSCFTGLEIVESSNNEFTVKVPAKWFNYFTITVNMSYKGLSSSKTITTPMDYIPKRECIGPNYINKNDIVKYTLSWESEPSNIKAYVWRFANVTDITHPYEFEGTTIEIDANKYQPGKYILILSGLLDPTSGMALLYKEIIINS